MIYGKYKIRIWYMIIEGDIVKELIVDILLSSVFGTLQGVKILDYI